MKFGDILHSLIAEHELTQKELAGRLNIAASTLSSYVQNMREPDYEMLKSVARYFEVSTDYLLGYSVEKTTIPTANENELLRIFKSLTQEQQQMYLEQGKAIMRVNAKKDGILPQSGKNYNVG